MITPPLSIQIFSVMVFASSLTLPALLAADPGPVQWGERYAAALIEGSPDVMQAAVPAIFAEAALRQPGADRLLGQMIRLRDTIRPGEFHHAELLSSNPAPGTTRRVLHVYVRRRDSKIWHDIQMILDPAPPHRIASIVFVAEVTEPVTLPNGEIDHPSTLEWLDRYVDKLRVENDLAGSVLVARGDRVLFERHFGFADAARRIPVTDRTGFNLGSGNKMFTALAITRLIESGSLQLDDAVTKFLPDFPAHANGQAVTVRHLLTHRAGVKEYWRPENATAMQQAVTWHDLLGLVRNGGYDFAPGTEARYSNSNFLLLGAIIEQVTGRDYFEVVDETVYRPAGMTESGSGRNASSDQPPARRLTRIPAKEGWQEAPGPSRGSPAGGGYSTGADMLRFSRTLLRGAIVAPASLKRMTTDANADLAEGFPYGHGFTPQQHGRQHSWGHGGIAPGVNFEFRYFPWLDITFVVFSNQDNGAYDDLRKNVTRLITGER